MDPGRQLIRRVDGVELPTAGWWGIGWQRVSLHTVGLRRRTLSGTASGGMTMAAYRADSTLDLVVAPTGGCRDDELVIHAALTSAGSDGLWRFSGSVDVGVLAPIAVDVRYHGVYRRGGRAVAWLAVRAPLPGGCCRPRLVLEGDINAELPATVHR